VQTKTSKLYAHPVSTIAGKHKNPDTQSSLSEPNRHAECMDCHNSHQAQAGLHRLKTNAVSGTLFGVSGIIPGSAAEWTQPTTYTTVASGTEENQICFKCHSYFALGFAPNGVTTAIGPSGVNVTDQAMEFNPLNHSAHPVNLSLNNRTGALVPKGLTAQQLTSDWNSAGDQTMYCSDCHGSDQTPSSNIPQGPHGSNSKFMLTGNAKYWPANASGALWSLDDIASNRNNWQNDLFCVNCHPMNTAGQYGNNVHGSLNHQSADVKCITCHVAVPHGAKRSRLIGYASDVQPYNYSGTGTYDRLVITGFQKAADPLAYLKANCSTNGMCHGTQIGLYEQ